MFLLQRALLRRPLQAAAALGCMAVGRNGGGAPRWFTESRRLCAVKPVLLADIGEGIVECEVIQWFVEPGARVEEFSPLCEVQSDKASVEITSRFCGTVKRLYYEAGEMARVGKPFVDIDIEGGGGGEPAAGAVGAPPEPQPPPSPPEEPRTSDAAAAAQGETSRPRGKMAALATPAVRHLSRELGVDIADIDGSGRDGRVLKQDIYEFVERRAGGASASASASGAPPPGPAPAAASAPPQTETRVPLTTTQLHMFRAMTRSLAIPHFLYADEMDMSALVGLRARLNAVLAAPAAAPPAATPPPSPPVAKLTYLPFIIKAVSLALQHFPVLNARVDADAAAAAAASPGAPLRPPALVLRALHNVGVAMDTPHGLLVPVVRDVAARSVLDIAAELARLQALALAGRLAPADMAGGTITVSNIGNIGGTYLSPVIVEREVAILAVGRMRAVPAFGPDDKLVRKHICNFSWCADHRVVDGATLARASEAVRRIVEEPHAMVMHLR